MSSAEISGRIRCSGFPFSKKESWKSKKRLNITCRKSIKFLAKSEEKNQQLRYREVVWKRCCFILISAAFLVVALFPLDIFLKVIEFKAKSDFKKRFDVDFAYEKIFWHEGMVHFLNGSINKGEVLKATFSEASFAPYFNLLKREIGGTLLIYEPLIEHRKKHPLPSISMKKTKFPFVKLCLKLQIDEGLLFFEENEDPISLNFQQKIIGEKMVGRVVLEWQTKGPSKNDFSILDCAKASRVERSQLRSYSWTGPKPLETFFSYENGCLEMATHFRDHKVSKISEMFVYFFGDQIPPYLTDWKVVDGTINGRCTAHFDYGNCVYLEGALHLCDVEAKNEVLSICGNFDTCDALFDIETAKANQWNGEFSLQGGNLALEEEYWHGLWDIDSLQSTICVKKGEVESSVLQGIFMGMNGEINLDWHDQPTLMHLAFSGCSKEMSSIIPEKFKAGFSKSFPDDYFELDATVSRHLDGLELKGKLYFEEQSLDFGCHFGGGIEHPADLFLEPVPQSVFINQLKSQFCLSKKWLGWFEAKQFPLEKCLAPYLFTDDVALELTGNIDVKGSFDERYLVMFYEGNQIKLEGPSFSLVADSISDGSDMMAVHYIDLKTWDHVGYLPLKGAKHHQKNYSLHLDAIDGLVQFENKTIRINDVKTNWQGLLIEGKLEIQINSLTDIDIALDSSIAQGTLMVGSRFLSHFVTSPLLDLPLLGTFSTDELSFKFHNGTLATGSLKGESHFEMEPFYQTETHYAYDCTEKKLEFSKTRGVLKLKERPFDFVCDVLTLLPQMVKMDLVLLEEQTKVFDLLACYDKVKDELTVTGENVSIQGFGVDGRYHFPKILFGDWIGSCDLAREPTKILVETFQLKHPEKGEFEFTGEFDRHKRELKGNFDSIDIELAPLLGKTSWNLKGHLSGKGELECSWHESQARFYASSTDLEFAGIPFDDGKDLQFSFSSDLGLFVEGLGLMGAYRLEALHYDHTLQKVFFEDFNFSFTPDRLPWVSELASTLFPGKFHQPLFDMIYDLKEEEPFEGSLSLEVNPENLSLTLYLNDGSYKFLDRQWNLKDFILAYNPSELFIKTQTVFKGCEYGFFLKTDSSSMQRGTLCVSDEADLMTAEWRREPNIGWSIEKVEGSVSGIDVHLVSNESEIGPNMTLLGHIQMNPTQLGHLFPSALRELKNRFDFGGIYLFDGSFTFSKEDLRDYTFYGDLTGSDCKFNHIEVAQITANCDFSRDFLEFSNLAIKDWSGSLYLDHATLLLRDSWAFNLSHLALQDFRLSRLSSDWTRRERGDRPLFRSLFIPTFELNHFKGELFEKLSYEGEGSLRFTNFPKRTFFSNLMMVPTEITARIGLDPTSFIPVRGVISYKIERGRVEILDFEDMYSDGKRSRFYLADNSSSYINLEDGSVNMNVKMKQYNILMKLAELFTVSVKGPLFHPSFVFTSSDSN